MPEPLQILQAMCVAMVVAVVTLAAIGLPRGPASPARSGVAWSLAVGLGFLAGCWMLGQVPRWPPKVDLDRLLGIVVPLVVAVECGLACWRASPRIAWPVRALVALLSARVLLHNSIYLVGNNRWSTLETWLYLTATAVMLTVVWFALAWFTEREENAVGTFVLTLTAVAAGVAIMLSGYATGGQLALPLAAAIAGTAGTGFLCRIPATGSVGVGLVIIGSLILVGKFFAELSTVYALLVWTAPLWCLLTELPLIRNRNWWLKNTLAVVLVAAALAVVLVQVQRRFDERSGTPTSNDPTQPTVSDYLNY